MSDKKTYIAKDGVWLEESVAERLGVEGTRVEQAHDLEEITHMILNISPDEAEAIRKEFPERS